jgi:alanine racemase
MSSHTTAIPSSSRPTIDTSVHTPAEAHDNGKGKGKVGSTPSRATGTDGGPNTPSRASNASAGSPLRSNQALSGLNSLLGAKKVHPAAHAHVPPGSSSFDASAMLKTTARTKAVVNMSNVRKNFRTGLAMIGSHSPELAARGGAVVKADGYGLDAAAFAKVLASEGCRDFFVAELSEAVKLRKAMQAERPDLADQISINVLGGLDMAVDPKWFVENNITPVINSVEQALHWNAIAKDMQLANKLKPGEGLDCILQFDSGMSRTGIGGRDIDRLMQAIDNGDLKHIAPQLMMSHLAKAGDTDPATADPETHEREPGADTLQQLSNFNAVADRLKERYPHIQESLGASSTVFLGKSDLGKSIHKNMVRMGATFHAQAPFEADTNPLLPTLTVSSKLGSFTAYEAGAKVGYGGTYTVKPGGETLATIPVGYRDILPTPDRWDMQAADGSVPTVRVRTADGELHPCPFAGKPSMDMASINVSGIPAHQLKEGLEVVLIDDKVTPDQFAVQFGMGASYVQTKLASDRVAVVHEDNEAFPSPAAEPVVAPSPWSKAGRAARAEAAATAAV